MFTFSASILGAALAGGSPYGCGSLEGHSKECYYGMTDKKLEKTVAYARKQAREGRIDDLENLRRMPIVLFNGKDDGVVWSAEMRSVSKQLKYFVDRTHIDENFATKAGHVWSIDHGECNCGDCEYGSYSYGTYSYGTDSTPTARADNFCCNVNNCQYDLSGAFFRAAYGSVKERETALAPLRWIDQFAYLASGVEVMEDAREEAGEEPLGLPNRAGLLKYAIAYVPTRCASHVAACRVSVNYHGCMELNWQKRKRWSQAIDLNEYGENNDVIILYPQAAGDKRSGVGCWNWANNKFDAHFDDRRGVALRTVKAILDDLPNALSKALVVEGDAVPAGVLA